MKSAIQSMGLTMATLALTAGIAVAESGTMADAMTEKKDPGANALLAKLDRNQDGTLSQSEAAEHTQLAARFGELDTDSDGSLSATEIGALPAKPTTSLTLPVPSSELGEEEEAE